MPKTEQVRRPGRESMYGRLSSRPILADRLAELEQPRRAERLKARAFDTALKRVARTPQAKAALKSISAKLVPHEISGAELLSVSLIAHSVGEPVVRICLAQKARSRAPVIKLKLAMMPTPPNTHVVGYNSKERWQAKEITAACARCCIEAGVKPRDILERLQDLAKGYKFTAPRLENDRYPLAPKKRQARSFCAALSADVLAIIDSAVKG